jgi:hypothetical protein
MLFCPKSQTMKTIYTLIFSFFIVLTISAQVSLVGVRSNYPVDSIEVIEWQPGDTTILSSVTVPAEAYLFGASLFNSFTGNYYLNTITSGQNSLLSYQTSDNVWTVSPYPLMSNITEIDMSTGRIYTLNVVDEEILVKQYEIKDGTDTLIGIISEPGIIGLVVDAIGFNSNDGVLYYAGPDGEGVSTLFSMQVRANPFSFTKSPITDDNLYFYLTGLNYDNSLDKLFAMKTELDTNGVFSTRKIVEVNTSPGSFSEIASLDQYPYMQGGSSSFDQITGNYMFIGIDTMFQAKLVMVNTIDSVLREGWLPDGIAELACDNTLFSLLAYQQTSVVKPEISASVVYPNPASLYVNVMINEPDFKGGEFSLSDITGRTVFNRPLTDDEFKIDVSTLHSGVYHLILRSPKGAFETRKLIVR